MSNKQGTWIPLPVGLRQALELYILGIDKNRTEFVQELIEDVIIEKLESLPYDIGETLDRMYPKKNMAKHYRTLVKKVYLRQGKKQAITEVEEEVIEEEEAIEEKDYIDESIINSITESS